MSPGGETTGITHLLAPPSDRGADADGIAAGSGPQPGKPVGPYRLVRPLGAGGMAEVWLARRADDAAAPEVALKLPSLLKLREDVPLRFARERDILGALEHPNIARLNDAGVSDDGLPYLAMEFVRGSPLTEWCDRRQLVAPERLALFLQVLDAVQYAHERRVLHGDIKPSNILVTDAGQVRLLDFGVARLLAGPEADAQSAQADGRALTPEYASPELLQGAAAARSSDVWSLGVVLYELLAGVRPHRISAGAPLATLVRQVAEARVQRPSTRITNEAARLRGGTRTGLIRWLRGGPDAIVLRALASDPRGRYAHARQMADELRSFAAAKVSQLTSGAAA